MAATQAVNPPSQQSFLFSLGNAGLLKKGQRARGSQTEQCAGCGVSRDLREGDVILKRAIRALVNDGSLWGGFQPAAPGSGSTLSLHWGNNSGLNAAENYTSFLASGQQAKQLLCNVCQMSFPPWASTFSTFPFIDKSCDGAVGGPTAVQVSVMSYRVPAGSPGLWQGLGRSAQGSAPSFLQGSAWLIVLTWATELYLQKSASKWVICVYFSFLGRESISQTWGGITTNSLNYFFPLPYARKEVSSCATGIIQFTTTSALELTSVLPCCSCRQFSRFPCRDTKSLCSSTDNPLLLPPDGKTKATDWLVPLGDSSSEPGQECRRILSNGKSSVEILWTVTF